MSFSATMAAACGAKWQRMHTHPFVREIGLGTLPREKYSFYLEQDYLYLIEFCRLLALLASKAPDLETMGRFKDLLKETLESEMDLHVRTCREFGISKAQLENAEPAPACLAYTSYLLATASNGDFLDGVVALLPCAWGYLEVGCSLAAEGLPREPCYREWIETYSGKEMEELVAYLKGLTDKLAIDVSPEKKERLVKIFERSVEFEIMFWEMGYNVEIKETAGE